MNRDYWESMRDYQSFNRDRADRFAERLEEDQEEVNNDWMEELEYENQR